MTKEQWIAELFFRKVGQPQPAWQHGKIYLNLDETIEIEKLLAVTGLGPVRNRVANLRDHGGTTCPVCDQHVRRYKRCLNSGMVATLCWLVRNCWPGEWMNISKLAPRKCIENRGYGLLKVWGLATLKPNAIGLWRPTLEGVAFVYHPTITASKYVYMYNNKVLSFGKEKINVLEALGKNFSYSELMKE